MPSGCGEVEFVTFSLLGTVGECPISVWLWSSDLYSVDYYKGTHGP